MGTFLEYSVLAMRIVGCVLVAICLWASLTTAEDADHLLPYGSEVRRHSFNAPFPGGIVPPSWSLGAGARIEEENKVRLTPARQSRMGYAWNDAASTMTDWEVVLSFQVYGQPSMGGDGFGFWYTSKSGMMGPVYGGMDYWDGLGIFFDTFNNDGTGDFPVIVAVMNDGSLAYDASTDGASQAIGSCSANFRQLDYPSQVRITYQYETLTVAYDLASNGNWVDCFSVQNVELGVDKYFGLTAGTGDLADNHDVFSFRTRTLTPSNVDLQAIRDRFKSRHDHYNMATGSSIGMETDTFQNEVLRILHQVQGTVNLIEASTIDVKNSLSAPAGGYNNNRNNNNANSANSAINNNGEISQISRMVSDLSGRLNEAISSRASPSLTKLMDEVRTVQNAVQSIRGGVNNNNNNGAAVAATVDTNAITRAVGDRVRDEINRAMQNLPSRDVAPVVVESSGGGWTFGLVMFAVGVGMGWGVSWYMNRSSRNAFKLP